jgi:peptidyl-dipeptidase Dcp
LKRKFPKKPICKELKMNVLQGIKNISETINPLLREFNTPFGTPPFGDIRHEHFMPAFKAGIKAGLEEIDFIATKPEAPSFENTISALSRSGRTLNRVSNVFYPLNDAETDTQMQEIAREAAPLLADYHNDILFNQGLFERVKAVFAKREELQMSAEETTLLEKTYKMFVRNGAGLDAASKARLREISRALSELSLKFDDNLLAETNHWFLHLTSNDDMSGLPESQLEAAAAAASKRGLEGWVITLKAPSMWPFLQYADRRALREQVFRAANRRGFNGNQFDNREIIRQIANLRLERANLLGYATHAHFVLEERMAESPQKVKDFLRELLEAARPKAMKDLEEVQQLARETGADHAIEYWDWYYYAERMRKARYDFDQELLRPFFELDHVIKGVFELAGRLWGLRFVPNEKIPVYHTEVTAYEVYDDHDTFLAILFLDFFPREGKSPGAWMTGFREQERIDGHDIRPQVSLVCNFTRPTETKPSLLTHGEFNTFLHEFGHALHGMFSQVTYSDLSGTNVYRDFVELPSQIMENWAVEREYLDLFARHYLTGEKIPAEMVEKIVATQNFHAAFAAMRQLGFGLNDMAWHSITEAETKEVAAFERAAMEPARMFAPVSDTLVSGSFAHIFAGGYAAGYYSYKWAEVLDADAFRLFKEKGIFDRATAAAFREHILSKGGSEHPMLLYKRFRGSEPTIDALLEREGLR